MIFRRRMLSISFLSLLILNVYVFSQKPAMTIKPSQPTHYFYTPKAGVNPPWHLVTSLHEISFSFPANLQVQASLVDNIGRINFGAKYGILDNLSVGAGLAATLFHMGRGNHGIPTHKGARPRLGAFLCWGLIEKPVLENAITLHTQIGDHFSLGADYGMQITPHEWWSLILEWGNSIDFTAYKNDPNHRVLWYLNVDSGVRFHPPMIPAFNFDFGIDLEEFPMVQGTEPSVGVFFDVIFAMDVSQ